MEEEIVMQVNHIFSDKGRKKRLKAWSGILISPILTFIEEGISDGVNFKKEIMRGEEKVRGKKENRERVEAAVKILSLLRRIVGEDERLEIIRNKRSLEEVDITIVYPTIAFMPALFDSENLIRLGISLRNTSEYIKEFIRIVKYTLDRYENYIKVGLPEAESDGKKRRFVGQNCLICGSTFQLTEHHMVPRRWGGTSHINNLAVLCRDCHNGDRGIERIIDFYEKGMARYENYYQGEEIFFLFHNTRLLLNLFKHIERDVEDIVAYVVAEDLTKKLERL